MLRLCFPSKFRAYDRVAIKCDGREAATKFEPSIYEGETMLDPGAGGTAQLKSFKVDVLST